MLLSSIRFKNLAFCLGAAARKCLTRGQEVFLKKCSIFEILPMLTELALQRVKIISTGLRGCCGKEEEEVVDDDEDDGGSDGKEGGGTLSCCGLEKVAVGNGCGTKRNMVLVRDGI